MSPNLYKLSLTEVCNSEQTKVVIPRGFCSVLNVSAFLTIFLNTSLTSWKMPTSLLKVFGKKHQSGILCPVESLPDTIPISRGAYILVGKRQLMNEQQTGCHVVIGGTEKNKAGKWRVADMNMVNVVRGGLSKQTYEGGRKRTA